MTAVTLEFEDRLFSKLKQRANHAGYSFDHYVLYILNNMADNDLTSNSPDDIDAYLSSMQFHGVNIPTSETGKGNLSETKYMKIWSGKPMP